MNRYFSLYYKINQLNKNILLSNRTSILYLLNNNQYKHFYSTENLEKKKFDDIIITKSCANQIKYLRNKYNKNDLKLRISVDSGGCSGLQYEYSLFSNDGFSIKQNEYETIEDEESIDEDSDDDSDDEDSDDEIEDRIYEKFGVEVVVDTLSLPYLKGATIDYVEELIRSSFLIINNPNSEQACGCGSSFALKNFAENKPID